MDRDPLLTELGAHLGSTVAGCRPVRGGDINEAFLVELEDGRRVFVKTKREAPPDFFSAEAHGLELLRAAARRGASRLVLPEVLASSERFLALEALELGPLDARAEEELGRGLALLHRAEHAFFGLDRPGYIGALPQDNTPEPDWATFYARRRLAAQLELPAARRLLPKDARRRFERLFLRLPELLGPPEPPALLHGDLWSGNVGRAPGGAALFDPAPYGGHREIDLAMLRLFGRPSARFFSAYDEIYPRAPGHEERRALLTLYPLLVHTNSFGAGYVPEVLEALARYD